MTEAVETSLVSSPGVPELGAIAADLGEVALDATINEGVLRDIPIVGTLINLAKSGLAIRDRLYIRKVALFLSGIGAASEIDRRRFLADLDSEEKRREFGETVLLLLEKADDLQKPKLIGRIMAARIRGDIDAAVAYRLCAMVDRCYMPDLLHLRRFKEGTQREMTPIAEGLQAVGFLSQAGFDGGDAGDPLSGGVIYRLNPYGELLLKHGL